MFWRSPHIFNLTPVVQTPKFANPTLRRIATGWTFSTIYRYQTGSPLTIASGLDQALTGVGGQRANQTSADVFASNKGTACGNVAPCLAWLNPAAFGQPAPGTLGNLGVGTVLGPAFWQFDAALARSFLISERQKIEIRAEAFNVLNGLRPGNPGTIISIPNTFGRILSAQDPRIMQFALKWAF